MRHCVYDVHVYDVKADIYTHLFIYNIYIFYTAHTHRSHDS